MDRMQGRKIGTWGVLALALLLAACASPRHQAPVENRAGAPQATPSALPAAPGSAPVAAPPLVVLPPAQLPAPMVPEVPGKPAFYTVKPGDTLMRIGLDHGQNWRDIARWNSIERPNLIEVSQVLRVLPPGAEAGTAVARAVVPVTGAETRSLDGRPVEPALPAGADGSVPRRDTDEDVNWLWPAPGAVLMGFDDVRSKGLVMGGQLGEPVLAAADGRVVYAGSGLRGYGNLVILKHNNTYLTAYAHNQSLLVKEDQVVRRGQKIAEMGSSDAERVQLHFEIRRQGKPIDPARMLPPR